MTIDIDLTAEEYHIALAVLKDGVEQAQPNHSNGEHLSRAYLKLKRALICHECWGKPAMREYELGTPLCAQCFERALAFDREHESLPEKLIRWVLESRAPTYD